MSTLNQFLRDLRQSGKVEVAHEINTFEVAELRSSQELLQQYHQEDRLDVPGTAPAFEPKAALWAAEYLYRAIQFILLRHLNEQAMRENLHAWTGTINPEVIYSADLCLRHLPTLFSFAKGLAPNDPLLLELKKTASDWPFSGFSLAEANKEAENRVLSHPALALAYVDRIIAKKLKAKAQQEHLRPWVAAALGNYADQLWPNWAN